MKIKSTLLLSGFAVLLTSCASPPLALAPVGPAPISDPSPQPDKGVLQVYSETQEYYEDQMSYFPHTDYQLYTADGRRLKRVWNHQNHEDEYPALVTLPPGNYVVRAWAEFYGLVNVPVVIRPNETTTVILQPGWKPGSTVPKNDLVKIPDGYYVGWRANLASSTP